VYDFILYVLLQCVHFILLYIYICIFLCAAYVGVINDDSSQLMMMMIRTT